MRANARARGLMSVRMTFAGDVNWAAVAAPAPPPVVRAASTPASAAVRDPAAILAGSASRPAGDSYVYFVQAGAFSRSEDAEQQRARLAMHRITTQIRTTATHQPVTLAALNDFKLGKVVTDSQIILMDAANNPTSYKYDAPRKELICVDVDGNEFVAVRGVEAFSVKFEPMRSDLSQRTGGVYDLLMRATITMTVSSVGQNSDVDEKLAAQTITLSSSVVPRCNVW